MCGKKSHININNELLIMLKVHYIKELIEKKNLTVKSFAEKVGISRESVYDIYQKEDTKSSTIDKIASVLEVPIASLYENTNMVAEPAESYKSYRDKYYELLEKHNALLEDLTKRKIKINLKK